MNKKKLNSNQKTKTFTALISQNLDTNLSIATKESIAKLLIKVLLSENSHKYKNRPYELPTDFCTIYSACLKLREKEKENKNEKDNENESYKTIHRFFLRCSQGNWEKVSFFDIYNTLTILQSAADNKYSDSLKEHLKFIYDLIRDLDFLYNRYENLKKNIFSKPNDENTLKKNLLLSLCNSDKNEFYIVCRQLPLHFHLENPYKSVS